MHIKFRWMPFAQESKIAVSCSFMMIHFLPAILIFLLSPKTFKSLPAVTLQISHSRIFLLLRLQPAPAPGLDSRVLFQDSPKRSRRERDGHVRRGTSLPLGCTSPRAEGTLEPFLWPLGQQPECSTRRGARPEAIYPALCLPGLQG